MSSLVDAADALTGDISDRRLSAVVAAAKDGAPEPGDVARLARVLAGSGTIRPADRQAADVASSGGPGSLSTLLSPLELVRRGLRVPKVAVPGRPAGGIDALGTVQGYRTRLTSAEFEQVLAACGYAHALAGADLAPLDGRLFAYRQAVGAQRVPALVVASLLSKKIAAGLSSVVLDVRVGDGGNLGVNADQARDASRLFVDSAALLGIRAVCVLSAMSALRQPFVGRGEALHATALATGLAGAPAWLPEAPLAALAAHAAQCRRLAAMAPVPGTAAGTDGSAPDSGSCLTAHLSAQGAPDGAFERTVAHAAGAASAAVVAFAPSDGFLTVDLTALRDEVVAANATAPVADGASFPDAAGVTFLAMPGEPVRAGQPVARVRGMPGGGGWLGAAASPPEPATWDEEAIS